MNMLGAPKYTVNSAVVGDDRVGYAEVINVVGEE
jgi:hypothetical protein